VDAVRDYLQPRQVLLVIDNCEHLISACAEFAQTILQATPRATILATSREALAIDGEVALPIQSLSLPAVSSATVEEVKNSEAVRLFCERAAAVQPGFTLNDQNCESIQRLCSRLDGIPLALELAAALVRGLSPEQIASRLDDRFRLLTGGSRTALPRQRTLEATIDWSYQLLSDEERLLLLRLSVFAAGWTLEAAESVAGDDELPSDRVLETQLRLVDKSLVIADTQAGRPRYRMLETVRQFAQQRLDNSDGADGLRRRHARFFTGWVERMGIELRAGSTQLTRFAELEVEQANLEAALGWSLGGGEPELGLRLVGTIFYFWWRAGHWTEWGHWTVLASPHLQQASEAARAAALVALGAANLYLKRDAEAARLQCETALALYRRLGDRYNIAWTIYWVNYCSALLMKGADEYGRTVQLGEEAIGLLREIGDLAGVAQGLSLLGEFASAHGDVARAKAAHQESLEIARLTGDQIREHVQYSNLGNIAQDEGDYEAALALYQRNLMWAREHGNVPFVLSAFADLSVIWALRGQPERAARVMGAAEAVSRDSGVRLQPAEQAEYDEVMARVREHMGSEKFDALRVEGQAMKGEAASQYALGQPSV
jgi:non-specific serine/threonine protein kinase